MKREYKKPYLLVESFQLNAAVAAACSTQGFEAIGYGENSCGFDPGIDKRWAFFNNINCDFDLTGPEGDGNDTICYHGPSLGVTFIAS